MIVILLSLLVYTAKCADPVWSNYRPNVMYSGQYKAFLTPKPIGPLATVTQPIYRVEVNAADYFTTAPKVILSLLGLRQTPTDTNSFVGFDVRLWTITTTNFKVNHTIFGSGMGYLNYMYLALSVTNTDFFLGQYSQSFDQTSATKTYVKQIQVNVGQTYPNYPTNTIQMKGFLAGYSLKQGTSSTFEISFALSVKNVSYFTIQVSTNSGSVLQKINFYRIGYDRTAIERRTNRNVFRDFYFELINNVNVKMVYNFTWGLNQFQYRNFLMGTNKININPAPLNLVEFFLYYYFAESFSKIDYAAPAFIDNPAKANYLFGEVFYHAIANCASVAPEIYFHPVDRKCYASCPTLGYFTDTSSLTCIACHYTCRTCSAGYLNDKCLSCDSNYRVFDSFTSKCNCPTKTYDDFTNLQCPSCHLSCLTCSSSAFDACKSCDSSLNRQFTDTNNDGVGQCICKVRYFQNATTQCQSCPSGCLTCSLSAGTKVCSNCDTSAKWILSGGNCICPVDGYVANYVTNVCDACHYSCKTCSEGMLANKCSSCDSNFRQFDATTLKCNCPQKTYDDMINLLCPSCHTTCLTCISTASDGCKSCNSSLKLQLVDPNGDGIGECLQKVQICGDGILTQSQQCDDNNVENRDGCSSVCRIQEQHVCFRNANLSSYSICYFNGTIIMTITDVEKSPYANQVSLAMKIDASPNLNQFFLTNYLTSEPSIVIQDVTARLLLQHEKVRKLAVSSNTVINAINYDSLSRILYVTFSYSSTFDITKKKIKFQPSLSSSQRHIKYFYNSPEAIITLEKTYNKIDTTYYDPSDYQRAYSLKYAFLVLIVVFWSMSFVMIAIGKGNIGMEMMIVLQIAYVSLLSQQKLEISFAGLLEFGKYTAGYNAKFLNNDSKCVNFSAINLSCNLFNNLNISFYLMVFIAILYWALKLLNILLNKRAEKEFTQKKHQRYMEQNHERTDQNIVPNLGFNERVVSQSHLRSVESQSVRKIEQNYYKDQQFIPQKVYNILLDVEFYLCFVTVMIWSMSITFIKQSTIESIVEAICIPVFYLGVWIFWFMKYFKEDFSFIKAHKRNPSIYDDDQGQSQQQDYNSEVQRNVQPQSKPTKTSRFSASFLKLLIYPLVWLLLLGLGVLLALSQPVGFVPQACIIGGSLIFLILNIKTEMHQEKLHMLRSVLNCILLAVIQGLYILSQFDSVVGPGLPISIIIFAILCFVFLTNSAATLYLFRLQVILLKKKQQSRELQKIQLQINQLQTLKRQKQIQNGELNPNVNLYKSSQYSRSQIQATVKKDPKYAYSSTYDQSPIKTIGQKEKMTKEQVNKMLNQHKITFTQQYIPTMKKQTNLQHLKPASNTLLTPPKKKLFSQKNIEDLSSNKFQSQSKNNQFLTNDFRAPKYL